jgi:uncharacterized membrane protein
MIGQAWTGSVGLLGDAPLSLEYMAWWQGAALFAALAVPIVWLGVRSLNGLGPVRKWVALGVRLAVVALIVLILGGVRFQREHHDLEVMVLKDVSQSTLQVHGYPGEQAGETLQASINDFLQDASSPDKAKRPAKDRIAMISFDQDALIDAMPQERLMLDARAIREPGSGTDVASALQLALATMSRDAMHRLLLITDGNTTAGDLEPALAAVAAAKIPVDVMPLRYDIRNEIMIDRIVAPQLRREGEAFSLDVVMRSTNPADVTGRLTVYHSGEAMDLDPYTEGMQTPMRVTLHPGTNVVHVRVPPQLTSGTHQFKAVIEAENVGIETAKGRNGEGANGGGASRPAGVAAGAGDTLLQNNEASASTFVRGKGKILFIDNTREQAGRFLREGLAREGIHVDPERTTVDQFPQNLVMLQSYDAVVLSNVPRGAGGLSDDQQKMLASYVHDTGGGLVMIGGDDAFGAGGWQGSRLEEILPVNMDIPAQRQIAKGALVLIVHSCEFDNGNYWGEQCALKAAETLSAKDEIGVISFDWGGGGSRWDYPLSEKGDGSAVVNAIKKMKVGDMPSFDDSMSVALNGKGSNPGLAKSDAKQKHVIIISDGDPQRPAQLLLDAYKAAKVTVSTVSVYPHGNSVPPQMKDIADELKGKYYGPINSNFNQLPQIFIKEASVVRRSLIQENAEGIPLKQIPSTSDMVKGIEAFPAITGMVLTSRKQSPQIDMPLVAGKNNDPVLASWQTGLGRAAVFTSDAHNRWASGWVGSAMYDKFWAQVVRGVARPAISPDFDVQVVQDGDKGKVIVEALDKDAQHLNFLNVRGQVAGPDLKPTDLRLNQVGPGLYETEFDAKETGSYVVSLFYSGQQGQNGWTMAGMSRMSSPELRDLRSNDSVMEEIARRTGGRVLPAFDASKADLFSRQNVPPSASPLPIWDRLIPLLLGMILVDVATRRIAWDWASTKRFFVGQVTRLTHTTRKVEAGQTLGSLKQVREQVAEGKLKRDDQQPPAGAGGSPPPIPMPDPTARFDAGRDAPEGDISNVVGGATDKPVPKAPQGKVQPKGLQGDADTMGGLMAAKRRARQKIEEQEKKEE